MLTVWRCPVEQRYSYHVNAHWTGARTGSVRPDKVNVPMFFSVPPEFGGEGGHWTPEHMLIAAVASCYVGTFSTIAQMSKFEFLDLDVTVNGTLAREDDGWRFSEIVICPKLVLADEDKRERGERLLKKAERSCLVVRSLSAITTLQVPVRAPAPEVAFAE